jgi:predicted phosphodiesterase
MIVPHATHATAAGLDSASAVVVRATALRSFQVLSAILLIASAAACREVNSAGAPAFHREVRETIAGAVPTGALALPNARTSVKFAVIGDSGRGTPPQHEVAAQMKRFREEFGYSFVLMVGDNIYEGPATPEDYRLKFEEPYRDLLAANVRFFAVLGNHDDPQQIWYPPFNMNGQRYYTFVPPEDVLTRVRTRVEFFALDSTQLDRGQLQWLDERLGKSSAAWKIVFLHHPLYTSGRYRDVSRAHRWALEPLLVRHNVDAVFSGHEHIYQRSVLQSGIQYFVTGGAGSLRPGDGVLAPFIARTYDDDYHFMLAEIDGEALHFQAISRTGDTIDAGVLQRRRIEEALTPAGTPDPQ